MVDLSSHIILIVSMLFGEKKCLGLAKGQGLTCTAPCLFFCLFGINDGAQQSNLIFFSIFNIINFVLS